ncbi:MAG TPA: PEP/pyruvate-binding domain-containing protein [Stellaceae bacterium]|nr:PEP/pyruvate-binding domain-containing protein [Stellaceae bacterium]
MTDTVIIAPGVAAAPATLDEIGGKAFYLAALAQARLPVPPAFVLKTEWCRRHRRGELQPDELAAALKHGVVQLERITGLGFGSARKPLVVAVRSGAKVSMPGMLETVLDIGLNDTTVEGLIRATGNPRLAWDSYRRLVGLYAEVVAGLPPGPFEALTNEALEAASVLSVRDLDYAALRKLARAMLDRYRHMRGEPFPQEPQVQLAGAAEAVLRSWDAPKAAEYRRQMGIDDDIGTAVLVQTMVFGNAGPRSGAGVGFTRDPATGKDELYLDFQFNAQGEDVVAGRHAVDNVALLKARLPSVWTELDRLRHDLERQFRDAQDFEMTVQEGRLYLLQTRRAKRTPWAAVQIAVDLVRAGVATPAEGLRSLDGIDLATVARSRVVGAGARAVGRATAASLGVASGPIALDAEAAARHAASGRAPILVRRDTTTSDIGAMKVAAGVLTAFGGKTSHAAVVARQLGIVCLVGCSALEIDPEGRACTIGSLTLREGDMIGLDANEGTIYAGAVDTVTDRPTEALAEIRRWSDPTGTMPN